MHVAGALILVLSLAGSGISCAKGDLEKLQEENQTLREQVDSLETQVSEYEELVEFLQNPPKSVTITGRESPKGRIVFQRIPVYEEPPMDPEATEQIGTIRHGTKVVLMDRMDTGVQVFYRVRAFDRLKTDGWVNERFVAIEY